MSSSSFDVITHIHRTVHAEICGRILDPSLLKILSRGRDYTERVLRGYEEAITEARSIFGRSALDSDRQIATEVAEETQHVIAE